MNLHDCRSLDDRSDYEINSLYIILDVVQRNFCTVRKGRWLAEGRLKKIEMISVHDSHATLWIRRYTSSYFGWQTVTGIAGKETGDGWKGFVQSLKWQMQLYILLQVVAFWVRKRNAWVFTPQYHVAVFTQNKVRTRYYFYFLRLTENTIQMRFSVVASNTLEYPIDQEK